MIAGMGVKLTPLDRCHTERTRAWMNDPELARLLGRGRPVSDFEHERWVESLAGRHDCAFFAILDRSGQHIGNVWLWDIDNRHRKAELRIVLGEHTGHGLGTEAIRLAVAYGFEWLNLHKIFAFVLGINPRARRAFEKAAFELEGTLRSDRWVGDRYADVWLLGRIRPGAGSPEGSN